MAKRTCKNCGVLFEDTPNGRGQWQRFCSEDCRDTPRASTPILTICSVPGCDTTARSGKSPHCEKHYYRLRRNGMLDAKVVHRSSRGTCQVEGCDTLDQGHDGYCAKHHRRISRHGDPGVVLVPIPLSGPDNPTWKGEDIQVKTAHRRVVAVHGRAAEHDCVDCGEPAQHWSYDHGDPDEKRQEGYGPYSTKVEHYQPRCVPCHKKFDLNQ